MATYIGFSTKHINQVRSNFDTQIDSTAGFKYKATQNTRKFRLTDEQLVIDDFINMLNIPQGQMPGRPEVGTTLWSFVFEPNTTDVQIELEKEIKRVAELDPRLILNQVNAYPDDQGILLELEIAVVPFNNSMVLNVYLDSQSNTAFGT